MFFLIHFVPQWEKKSLLGVDQDDILDREFLVNKKINSRKFQGYLNSK